MNELIVLLIMLTSIWSVRSTANEPSGVKINPYDGGYSGLVIQIKDEVPEDECAEILQNIPKMLSGASRSLYTAMNRKVYFEEATIVVPSTWRDVKCKQSINVPRTKSSYGATDIFVGNEDPVYHQTPFTQQTKGCGEPGDHIWIPHSFLTNWNDTWSKFGDPAKVFVHEWAKYRYGIFDQVGYPGDPVYPNYLKMNGNEIVPTGSSNVRLSGKWRTRMGGLLCDPEDDHLSDDPCTFQVETNDGVNSEVTCSMGNVGFLSGVSRYCLKDEEWNYDQLVMPTKHNGICGANRPAMDLILSHLDISAVGVSSRSPKVNMRSTPPKTMGFRILRQPRTKYILIMESSSSMRRHDLWKWVSKAAQKFIRYDMPDDSKLSIVTFNNESTVHHQHLTELVNDKVRARLADTIPDKYKVDNNPNERCVLCGVDAAMKTVLLGKGDGHAAGAHLIIVTRGDDSSLTKREADVIMTYAKENKVRFSSILVPEQGKKPLAFYDSVSQFSGGQTFVFPTSVSIGTDTFHRITEAFKDLRKLDTDFPSDIPVTIHRQIAKRSNSLVTRGSFKIDSTLGRDTIFGILVEDVVNYFINSATFIDTNGKRYGPYTSFTNDYNVINFKTINFPQDSTTPPFDDPAHLGMTWKYEVLWYDGGQKNLSNVILVESKPRDLGSFGLVNVEAWLNVGEVVLADISPMKPLKIFAKVTRGNSPVMAAEVRAKVVVTGDDGTVSVVDEIRLLDNGNGDPDVTGGDGVYSRYWTKYPAAGRYRFVVSANDNQDLAYTIQIGRGGRAMPAKPDHPERFPACCGSRISVPQDLRLLTGGFRRNADKSPIVHINSIRSVAGADSMPPSRIVDLRLRPEDSGDRLMAQWTSPGDDYDYGRVAGYKFLFGTTPFDLLNKRQILHKVSRTDEAGSLASYSFTFNKYDKDYHIALVAIDSEGNQGNISNIVLINLPSPSPMGEPESAPETGVEQRTTTWLIVGIAAGIVAFVLLLLLIFLYAYFVLIRRRQAANTKLQSSGVNVDLQQAGVSAGSDASSYDDVKNSSSNHLVPATISTISNVYKQQQVTGSGGTSFRHGLTPTYWSASQLLKEHEERKRREEDEARIMGHPHHPELATTIVESGMNMGYDYGPVGYGGYGGENEPYPGPMHYDQYYGGYGPGPDVVTAYYGSGGVQPEAYHPIDYPPVDIGEHAFNLTVEGSSETGSSSNNNLKTVENPVPLPPKGESAASVPRGSDSSSAGTLGQVNPSLQGSLLSVDGGRPPSTVSKTRNITQV